MRCCIGWRQVLCQGWRGQVTVSSYPVATAQVTVTVNANRDTHTPQHITMMSDARVDTNMQLYAGSWPLARVVLV